MTINFENYGNFAITFYYDDNTYNTYNGNSEGYTLKECADFISENLEHSLSCVSADIIDIHTGEIVATIEKEEQEITEEDWYDWRDDEIGFDPYMGCYSDDC